MYPLRGVLPGIELYSGRSKVAVKKDDIAVVEEMNSTYIEDLKREDLGAYHYLHLPGEGSMPIRALNSPSVMDYLRKVAKLCQLDVQPYITTKADVELVKEIPGSRLAASRFNLVEDVNNKVFSRKKIFSGGNIKLLPGGCCDNEAEIRKMANRLREQKVSKIVVKDPDPYTASGKGKLGEIRAYNFGDNQFTKDLLTMIVKYQGFRGKKQLILEKWHEGVLSSPSVIGHISPDGRINLIATTSQIMESPDRVVYQGSIIPAQVDNSVLLEMFRIFQIVADYLVKRGWIGVFGIDFIVVDEDDKQLVIPTEINGRYTNSLYLANVMLRLGLDDWLGYSSNLGVSVGTTYQTFRDAIGLIDVNHGERIIPFNIDPLHIGRAAVMILIDPRLVAFPVQRAEAIVEDLKSLLLPGLRHYELAYS